LGFLLVIISAVSDVSDVFSVSDVTFLLSDLCYILLTLGVEVRIADNEKSTEDDIVLLGPKQVISIRNLEELI